MISYLQWAYTPSRPFPILMSLAGLNYDLNIKQLDHDSNQLNMIYCEISILFIYKSTMAEMT